MPKTKKQVNTHFGLPLFPPFWYFHFEFQTL